MRFIAFSALLLIGLSGSASSAKPDWRTPAEASNFKQTPRYAATRSYFERLDAASDEAQLIEFGTSPNGLKQFAFVIASDGEFTPEKAAASKKPVLLIQACIHAGENEGKDTLMALSREWLIEKKQQAARDGVILLLIPIFNVDGHERFGKFNRINQNGPEQMGWRSTAQNLNLNRDFLKAEAPEMRAWLRLWQAWNPALLVDMHNTDGADYQYHLTYHFERHASVHPLIKSWQNSVFLDQAITNTQKQGFVLGQYVDLKEYDNVKAGLVENYSPPRYSSGFGPAVNRPSLLLETHMMKDFKTRVRVNEAFLRAMIDAIGAKPAALMSAIAQADQDAAKSAGTEYTLDFQVSDESVDVPFYGYAYSKTRSEVSGALWTRYDPNKKETWQVPFYGKLEPTRSVTMPSAYLIPRHWSAAIRALKRHGIQYSRLAKARTLAKADIFRFSKVTYAPQPFESRVRVANFEAAPVQEDLSFAEGSVLVKTNQAKAYLIAHLLEPLAPDSLIRQGYGDQFMTRTEYAEPRVLEQKAREMLAKDSALSQQFNEKLKDQAFASSTQARLNFFYERLPFFDQQYLRYPVARLNAEQLQEISSSRTQ
jgi:Zinc carboxypeptidase